MYHAITVTHAMWAHLLQLTDLRQYPATMQRVTADGGHILGRSSNGYVEVGVQSTYGFVRPWKHESRDNTTQDPDYELGQAWAEGTPAHEDYYVVVAEGMRDGRPLLSRDIRATAFYPERVFVWGEDEEGDPLPRKVLLEHLQKLNCRGQAPFWDPCLVWRGYNRGLPTFYQALRQNTDIGISRTEIQYRLTSKLPAHYYWDPMPTARYGNLYYEVPEEEGVAP